MHKIEINSYGEPTIKLSLNNDFITEFHLEKLVNEPSYHLLHPPFHKGGITSHNFNLNCLNKTHSKEYWEEFLKLIYSLSQYYQIADNHIDHLIFLSKVYFHADQLKKRQINQDDVLRSNGYLLFEFIKVPLPIYDVFNVYKAFAEDDLSQEEIDDYLLMYLGVVSGLPEETFKKDEELSLADIDKQIQKKLILRIQADKNISIQLPNGNYLVVSKSITAKFSFKDESLNFSASNKEQNVELIKLLVTSLYNEQASAKTVFYKNLLDHDFLSNDHKKLTKSLGLWDRTGRHTSSLLSLRDQLINYLERENLITAASKPNKKRIRDNFVYQYCLIWGLFLDIRGELTSHDSIDQIKQQLYQFRGELNADPQKAVRKFKGAISNINR